MPKEPRPRDNRKAKNSGDNVTRNLVIGMVGLVVLSGLIFTVLDKRGASDVALPATIESIDSSNNGEPVVAQILPENDYGIVFNADTPFTIDIWEDFQCPACAQFEALNSTYIESIILEKKAKVIFHPLSFLGPESIRAANAAACAMDDNKFLEMHEILYQNQIRQYF